MLTALATILGALTNLGPSILQYFQKKQDLQHEIDMARLDMDKMELQAKLQTSLANIQADTTERQLVYANDASLDGGWFINALRASIRPVLTYIFFAIFCLVKVAAVVVILKQGLNFVDAIPIIWDNNTSAIFGAIIGFHFSSRMLEKLGYGTTTKK